MRRAVVLSAAIAILALLFAAPAQAEFRGSDPFQNITPERSIGGIADKYPLDRYGLDDHTEFEGVDINPITDGDGVGVDDPMPKIKQGFAAQIWDLTSSALYIVFGAFSWAFSYDYLTGPDGLLGPIEKYVENFHKSILALGGFMMWMAIKGRPDKAISGLAMSFLGTILLGMLVLNLSLVMGTVTRFTNEVSLSFLSGFSDVRNAEDGRQKVTDHLFDTFIVKSWALLNFGGLKHCVDTDTKDDDGFPLPVNWHDKSADVCRNHMKPENGYGGYADRFLRHPVGSEERNKAYEEIKDGEVDSQTAVYKVDKSDAPAVDIQQAGGATSRTRMIVLVCFMSLGLITLLGILVAVVLIATLFMLGLLGLLPIVAIACWFPPFHKFVKWWASTMGGLIIIKLIFAIAIAVIAAVSAMLMAATVVIGLLWAIILQTVFIWGILLFRKRILNAMGSTVNSYGGPGSNTAWQAFRKPTMVMAGGIGALAGVYAAKHKIEEDEEEKKKEAQEGALKEGVNQGDYRYDYAESSRSGSEDELRNRTDYYKSRQRRPDPDTEPIIGTAYDVPSNGASSNGYHSSTNGHAPQHLERPELHAGDQEPTTEQPAPDIKSEDYGKPPEGFEFPREEPTPEDISDDVSERMAAMRQSSSYPSLPLDDNFQNHNTAAYPGRPETEEEE
jgi:hypothetical protein